MKVDTLMKELNLSLLDTVFDTVFETLFVKVLSSSKSSSSVLVLTGWIVPNISITFKFIEESIEVSEYDNENINSISSSGINTKSCRFGIYTKNRVQK